jgi:methionyl-tRNA formyltransferase
MSMRIVFAGTPYSAAKTLEFLLANSFQVVGVLTKPDAQVGRQRQVIQTPVAELALEKGIPLYKANRFDQATRDWIRELDAELGLIVAYGCILKQEDLAIPKLGWMNLHFSLLPEFPGPAPVQHALSSGASRTGVTLFMLDEGIDSGPIVASRAFDIDQNINSAELLTELTIVGNQLLHEVLLDAKKAISTARAQPAGASFSVAVKPTRQMARIDFGKAARDVHNLIRAMNPEPIAWFEHDGLAIRVLKSKLIEQLAIERGVAQLVDGKLLVGCSQGSVELLVIQPAGKKPMAAADWYRGLRVENLRL